MNDETEELLKQIKAYRNDMVAHNYPFQEISNIITKWELKIAASEKPDPFFSKEPINSPMSEE